MKIEHLDTNLQLSYVYRTLDDARRESIDAHLAACPACRASLSEHQHARMIISREIGAALNGVAPPVSMSFSNIADQVTPSRNWKARWQAMASTAPVLLALSGLVLTLFGLWDTARVLPTIEGNLVQNSAYSTLAIFLFLLASVQEFDRSFSIRPRLFVQALVAGVLWLGSALIGLLNIIVIRDLTIATSVALGATRTEAVPVTIISVMLAVLLYIGVVIGGADHHFRNLGQAGSWKLFSFTLLGQLFLLILPYLLMPYLMS